MASTGWLRSLFSLSIDLQVLRVFTVSVTEETPLALLELLEMGQVGLKDGGRRSTSQLTVPDTKNYTSQHPN